MSLPQSARARPLAPGPALCRPAGAVGCSSDRVGGGPEIKDSRPAQVVYARNLELLATPKEDDVARAVKKVMYRK